ncbi:Squalene synthase [Forsythia ovata]|uniref:Squalene synthase n=1 Tax=Forsythia ovata TaxID=205694 RepID=A0ABD1QMX0_9LAMI
MSILSLIPATASISTATTRSFAASGLPQYFSSTSIRMIRKNSPSTVANCLREISSHRNPEFYPTTELNMVVRLAEKQIPPVPHWRFCYTMLRKVFVYGAFLIHRLDPELRNAVCILSLVLHALDTVEDDTSIATEVKVPIMMAFHRHIYDREWHFACGTKNYRVLMDKFHHVSTAFLELGSSYQEVIEDVTKMMGAGMAKFIFKEIRPLTTALAFQVETIDDYNEYCHYVAGIVGLGFAKLFHLSGIEDLPPDTFFHSVSIFAQKADVIQDYLEDINEIPKARMFWPRQIWSKYADKLEDFKYEKNSVKALYCLNEMVTNALIHAEDCLKNISAVQDPAIFQSCAMTQIVAIGTLASCYNNIQVFRGVEKMRYGLATKAVHGTKTISNFYCVFHDFTCILKSKIDDNDPNATKTKDSIEAILKVLQKLRNLKMEGLISKEKPLLIKEVPAVEANIKSIG